MGWKLVILAGAVAGTLWALGVRPEDVKRSADRLSSSAASAIASPDTTDWS